MRILAVHPGPNFSVADVHTGWVEALRGLGNPVADYNLDRRLDFYSQAALEIDGEYQLALSEGQAIELAVNGLYATTWNWCPDVLLVTSAFYISVDVLERFLTRGIKVVLLHTESPYEDDRQLERAGMATLNLLNDPTNIEQFRSVNPATYYVPHAYRPEVHRPQPAVPNLASDFCFAGTGYPSRIAFLEAVDLGAAAVSLAGNWQALEADSPLHKYLVHDVQDCCDNADVARLYASAKASANLYRREAQRPELSAGWAMGPREVELAAMGVFFLRDPRGEGDQVLPMLPTFAGPEDFGEQLRWWLDHDTARQDAALRARDAVADRTFTAHARQLLRLLDT